jgi:FlaA1/EpsC-like NDP-sugar epimerase
MDIDTELNRILYDNTVLVTGGTGSIGSEIVRQLLAYHPRNIRVFSNSENENYELSEELRDIENVRYLVGDVCSKERLVQAMQGVQIVFHAAAMKHVPVCEYNPLQAIEVDVNGTANVFKAAIDCGVNYLVNISTDKAVNPICTMGGCKFLGERIIATAREYVPRLIAYNVRFGNVLGSRGSILLKVRDYLRKGWHIGITDERMTRFIMTIQDAVRLVLHALVLARGSETFILKMQRVRVGDLIRCAAEYCINLYGIKMPLEEFLSGEPGLRPSEKRSESLLTAEEAETALETEDMILLPAPQPMAKGKKRYEPPYARPLANPRYESGDGPFLTPEEILALLRRVPL